MNTRELVLSDLTSAIVAIGRPHPVRVAIDGVDAAGKTSLADELVPRLERLGRTVIRSSIDGFHHPRAVRRRRGALSPEGYFHDSFNYPALIDALLEPLGPGGSRVFRRSVFDFRTDNASASPIETASADAVLLLDGVFLLRPELRDHFDYSIFVRADFETTIRRAEHRDVALFGSVDEVRRRYRERYIPGQQLYLSAVQPERWASIVIDNNNPSTPMRVEPASHG
jgi:uridine kinase